MRKVIVALICLALTIGCSSSDGDGNASDTFDRTALLTNWADNIIIPSFENYSAKVTALSNATDQFISAPTETNLLNLRASWLEAYKAYQYISMYSIGKSEELNLNITANTYPANSAGIETNVSNGGYNLELFGQFDKQGFPGLDYLINGLGDDDTAIVMHYTTNSNAAAYKQYLAAVVARLKTTAVAVVNDWNGTYRDNFISNNGRSVSSSVNKVTNLFVKTLEKDIRTGKLAIPAGIFSNGATFPEKVEAYYKNDISKELLNTAIEAERDFFNGKHFGNSTIGVGLKAYLDHLNAVRDGQQLSAIIDAQFETVLTANNTLNESFSEQVVEDNSKMVAAYNTLQQQVIYLKVDLLQALSISPDYVDGDGD